MYYRQFEFANIDNQRWQCAAGMMNFAVTLRKRQQGFTPPLTAKPKLIMYTLRCKLLAWGRRHRGVKKTLQKPCYIFFKVTMNFECLYTWSSLHFKLLTTVNGVVEVG